jgi:hypothetical protein
MWLTRSSAASWQREPNLVVIEMIVSRRTVAVDPRPGPAVPSPVAIGGVSDAQAPPMPAPSAVIG